MGEVVQPQFGKPPVEKRKLVLRCDCGCTTWCLTSEGVAECADCDAEASDRAASWRERLPPRPKIDEPVKDTSDDFRVIDLDNVGAFWKRNSSSFAKTVFAAIALEDGTVKTWARGDCGGTSDQQLWVLRRLREIRKHLCR